MVETISQASALAAAQSAANTNSTAADRVISSDFQTFLEMLTVQMQNQDPLNPIDSTDYAVQLATFSSVEQQVLTNDLLTALMGQMTGSGLNQLANWVGMEARSDAPAYFDGGEIMLAPLPAQQADEAWLVVRNDAGVEVSREQIGLTGAPIEWAGQDASGAVLPAGVYHFEVENHSDGALLGNTPVEHYAEVVEAQSVDGNTLLILAGGIQVTTSDVIALRKPDAE